MAFAFPAVIVSGTTTVTTAGTPVPLVATAGTVYASTIVISPQRGNSGATCWAGFTTGNLKQSVVLPWSITTGEGRKIDLSTIFVDVSTSGDKVAWEGLD